MKSRWIAPEVFAVLLIASVAAFPAFAGGQRANHKDGDQKGQRWVGTWATGPAGPSGDAKKYSDQTLRLIVHTSVGGSRVRIRISNTFGTEPLNVGSAHIAQRKVSASTVPGTDHTLTFGGKASFIIPAGGLVLSDPAALAVAPLSDLAISLYLPKDSTASTTHFLALQTNYVAKGPGDFSADADLLDAATTTSWDFLTGVDVAATPTDSAIVTLGDSITDGANSTVDTNRRWPNVLAARLQTRESPYHFGVLDVGVIGNRIMHPTESDLGNLFAPAALARFDRDVLGQAGVKYLIVLLGINDIGHPGSNAPMSEEVSAAEIIAGHVQLIARAHEMGIKAYGCTLTPFEDTTLKNFYSPEKEKIRQQVNQWIRTGGAYDAVIDFDKATRDPSHPSRFLPAFDGGDHLHPSDAGLKAMAEAGDLSLFR